MLTMRTVVSTYISFSFTKLSAGHPLCKDIPSQLYDLSTQILSRSVCVLRQHGKGKTTRN